jgi:uncharacterized protein YndB with AHSA1/START domain
MSHGTFETIDGRPAVRFERRLKHPVAKVWRAVTVPDELAHWFPSSVELQLEDGGRMHFEHAEDMAPSADGTVLELVPERTFEFTWGSERLRFELEPVDGGCLLRLTHFLSTREQAARDVAGWHVCLDRLSRHLDGEMATAPTADPTGEWRRHYEDYQERGVPAGAPVPGA